MSINDRYINLSPFNEISVTKTWDIHTLKNTSSVIVEIDGQIWYIEDDIEKICDVSKMPDYIKEDWVIYNKKEINLQVVESHINDYLRLKESKWPNPEAWDITLNNLKSIKRNLIIGKII